MSEAAGQHESVDVQIGLSHLVANTPRLDAIAISGDDDQFEGCRPGADAADHDHRASVDRDEGEPKSLLLDQLSQLDDLDPNLVRRRYDFSRPHRSSRPPPPWWILNPETRAYQTWACILLLLLLYTAVVQPLRIAFAPTDQVFVLDVIVDVLFTLDIVLSFVTAFGNERGRLERDPGRIARHYLKTYFLIDLISVFPFYLIVSDHRFIFELRIPRFIKLLKLFRILKMLQLYRLRSLLITLEYSPYVHQKLIRIAQLATIVLAFSHFLACAWYFVGVIGRDLELGPGSSWLERMGGGSIESQPLWYRYILSLYWALTTLTTVGYGDINAQTPGELVFAMFSMIMGSTLFAYTTATVASMIRERDHQAQGLREKMTALRQFASKHRLSTRLRSTLMKRMRRIWCAHVTNDKLQMAELMGELPSDLALRVTAELHRDLLERSAFVKQYDDQPTFVLSLFRQLLPLKLAQGEMLAHQGDAVRNWYIIESGEVRAVHLKYPTMVTYAMYGFGQTLGDVGLFTVDAWPASVRCATNCRLWMVNRATFLKMVEYFGLQERFVRQSKEKERELRQSMVSADRNVAALDASMTASELAMTIPAAIAAVTKPSSLRTFFAKSPNLKRDEQSAAEKWACQIDGLGESLRLMQSQLQELETCLKKSMPPRL